MVQSTTSKTSADKYGIMSGVRKASNDMGFKSGAWTQSVINENPYSGGTSGYGYGGSSGPTEETRKMAELQIPIAKAAAKVGDQDLRDMGKVYDQANNAIDNSAKAQIANLLSYTTNEWFPALVKQQAAYKALRKDLGNGASGSGSKVLNTLNMKAWDLSNGAIVSNLKNNLMDIGIDSLDQEQRNVNAMNELKIAHKASQQNRVLDMLSTLGNMGSGFLTGEEDGWAKTVEKSDKGKGGGLTKSPEDWLREWGITTDVWDNLRENMDYSGVLRGMQIYPAQNQRKTEQRLYGTGQRSNTSQAANRDYWSAITS